MDEKEDTYHRDDYFVNIKDEDLAMYDRLVNWLFEEHNEVFNQWAQIAGLVEKWEK